MKNKSALRSFLAITAALAAMTGAASAAVLINDTTNNGGFDSTTIDADVTIITGGWTSNNGVWIHSPGGTLLTSAPFGTDGVGAGSRAVTIHALDTDFRSAAFTLTAGELINFSVDFRDTGTVNVNLFDGTNSISLGSLTGGHATIFAQFDNNTASVAVTGSYQLRFQNVTGSDVEIDRVFLQSIPEPSSAALLGLGGLALILRRRK
jgi:hypothetical protein